MDAPDQPSAVADVRFVRVVRADARAVAGVRNEFGKWVRTHLALDEERVSDVVLAVNEALTNSAEFAYVSSPEPGIVAIEAVHSAATASLAVLVSDRGVWYDEDTTVRSRHRGRGISLMEALSDETTIDRLPDGTQVRLLFADCAAVPHRPGAMSEA